MYAKRPVISVHSLLNCFPEMEVVIQCCVETTDREWKGEERLGKVL